MASRNLPISKLKARRRKRRITLAVAAFVLLLICCGSVIGLSWISFIRIHTIEIIGASSVNEESVRSVVAGDLAGTYGHVFPKNNIFIYPRDLIKKHLLESFSALDTVDVRIMNFHTLAITVEERATVALWCGESLAVPSPCFLLDSGGVIYAPAADFSGEVYIKYYGAVSGAGVKQFVTSSQFRAVSALVQALRGSIAHDTPVSVSINKEDVEVIFENGFKFLYALHDDSAKVLERFHLATEADPFIKRPLSDFEYLDLRFGDKLYYKLKTQ